MRMFLWLLSIVVTVYFTYTIAYAEADRLAYIEVKKSSEKALLCEARLAMNNRYDCRNQCRDEISLAARLRQEVIVATYGEK